MALMRQTGGQKGFDTSTLAYEDPKKEKYLGSFRPAGRQQVYYAGLGMDELTREDLERYYQDALGYYGGAREDILGGQEAAMGTFGQALSGYDPYAQAGEQGLAAYQQGLSGALSRTSGAADALSAERQQNLDRSLGAAGLRRSGAGQSSLADVDTETRMALAQQDLARQQQLMQTGYGAQGARGNIFSQMAQSQYGTGQNLAGIQGQLAGLASQQGQGLAGLDLGLAQDRTGIIGATGQNLLDLYLARMEKNAMADSAPSGFGGAVGSLGSAAIEKYSDIRLKKNIKPLSERNGIKFYSYEANELGEKVGMDMDFGVIAQEIEETHPHLVSENNGYKMVNYSGVMEIVNGLR